MMKKFQVGNDIFQYCFNGKESPSMDYNIFALISGKQALIIDTAYSSQARQVRYDLERHGIKPKKVIISHFHPDHAGGSSIFKDCEIIGSKYYKVNLNNCRRWEPDYTYLEPHVLIKNKDMTEFGPFKLEFLYTPGHSNCSISTIINNEFIHVGDLIMTSNSNKPLLSIVPPSGSFFEHISSLEQIKNLDIENLLLAHGLPIRGKERIKAEIDDRIYYLKKVQKSRGNLKLKDCLKNSLETYDCTEWHETNVKYFKRFF